MPLRLADRLGWWWWSLLVGSALMALVVAGCADSDADEEASSPTESESPPPSSTTSLPDLPAIEGLTGDIARAHDPDIVRDGDWYYVFLTGEGVEIRRSRDLVHWEAVGSVFDQPHPDWMDYPWAEPGMGLGAPAAVWFGDRWNVYYHAHEFATNNAVTGLAWNRTLDPDDPDYEWVDEGLVMESTEADDHSVLDANVVVGDDGVPWMTFGSFWLGIQLVELDPETGTPAPDAPWELLAARDPWVLGVEASSLAYRDGYWYLFVSWGFCCQGVDTKYEIRVGRSTDLAGPYVDITGQPMLNNGGNRLLGPHGRVIGPGSGDVLVDDEDSWLVHHWYDGEKEGETTLGVRPLLWSPEGWPIAADAGFEPAEPAGVDPRDLEGAWVLSQYDPARDATVVFEPGGSLADGLGTWIYDPASGFVELSFDRECAALTGTNHLFVVGADLQTGFGYSDSAAALRGGHADGAATVVAC